MVFSFLLFGKELNESGLWLGRASTHMDAPAVHVAGQGSSNWALSLP